MRRALLLALLLPTLVAADFYRWVDESGFPHYADTLAEVPAQHRDQIEGGEYRPAPESSTVQRESAGESSSNVAGGEERKNWTPKVFTVKFRRWEGSARRIILDVTLNGSVTVPMILDTGAPGTIISYAVAERLGVVGGDAGALISMAGGIGGSTPSVETILDTVSVAGMKDTFVPTTVTGMRRDDYYEGLLGMNFMANYSMSVDHAHGKLVFEELPPDRARPGGHDREWWLSTYHQFAGQRSRWRAWASYLDDRERSGKSIGSSQDEFKRLKAFAASQVRQAEGMFTKLDRYASYNSVPMNWRRYE
jgi:hypothetical protein